MDFFIPLGIHEYLIGMGVVLLFGDLGFEKMRLLFQCNQVS